MPAGDHDIEAQLADFRDRYLALNDRIREQCETLDWATDNTIVLERDAMSVRRFHDDNGLASPVLVVYSHVNGPHVIDLHAEISLVRRLQDSGNTVYLLDWGHVSERDRTSDLSVYVLDYIDAALDAVLAETGQAKAALLGVCQGGTFALCHASCRGRRVGRLATLVTPVDFHAGDSVLTHWARHIDFRALEAHPVNVPGAAITAMFQGIRPFADLARQVSVIQEADNGADLSLTTLMDQWVFRCPDQPGRAFAQFCRLFYQENMLIAGGLELAGEKVALDALDLPVLNAYARNDHLVPAASSAALADHIRPNNYREAIFEGGHIGLMVSKKAQGTILREIGDWLAMA